MKKTNVYLALLITIGFINQSYYVFKPVDLDNQIVQKDGYIISYNETHEQPNWVAYTIKPSDLTCEVKAERKNRFKSDPDVLTGSATLKDYKRSGYDRGHLKASADESCNQDQMNETFYMSNMSPQKPGFNRGIWKNLEGIVRTIAKNNDSVKVICGPILTDGLETIGKNKVSVPQTFYKVVRSYKNGEVSEIGYLIPNEKITTSYTEFITTIRSIERVAKIKFPNKNENKLPNKIGN